ncbi:hypothetical protein [Piscinibacter sp.]|uniref:hypothetical protein n=1 Tax=Piscinibacter sp. TaxID=1903157 RepID=UPI002F419F63
MSDSTAVQAPAVAAPTRLAVAEATPAAQSGARWFWWISGLSLVNIVLQQSGSDTNFVVGLGMTAVADAVFASAKAIGFTIDAMALGFFFLMGLYGRRGSLWPFLLGAAVYLGDALIYLYVNDIMSVAFHALALFFILKGAMSLREALRSAGVR